ncbi:MAG: hypothetical protein RLZZ352_2465 [Pseudomonadota bacterium]
MAQFQKCLRSRAYPRIRGETVVGPYKSTLRTGLSPHSRGNRRSNTAFVSRLGPIPAFAGKPSARGSEAEFQRAYPRIRGETLK